MGAAVGAWARVPCWARALLFPVGSRGSRWFARVRVGGGGVASGWQAGLFGGGACSLRASGVCHMFGEFAVDVRLA